MYKKKAYMSAIWRAAAPVTAPISKRRNGKWANSPRFPSVRSPAWISSSGWRSRHPATWHAKLGITKPSVSALVARLLETGFIRKERSHADGRSFHLHLTTKGIEMMHAHQHVHEALAQHLLAGLDERQQEQLVALLAKVVAALSDQRSETLPVV